MGWPPPLNMTLVVLLGLQSPSRDACKCGLIKFEEIPEHVSH